VADTRSTDTAHFDINAAVVFRLGEELITDVVQALVELVKNSYDADATWVKVTIATRAKNTWGRKYKDASGVILVEDDGDGMTRSAIQHGWLTIANSPKRERKARGKPTERGRTPIGDKGLGRLGVQRLARNVEIVTRPREEEGQFYVAFSWRDFRDSESLAKVPVVLESENRGKASRAGTTLILSDLCEMEAWQGERNLQDLQRKLSGMISPFQEVQDFVVYLEVDGKQVELAGIAQQVRETAMLQYRLEFDGATLCVSGRARLDYLMPNDLSDRALLQSLFRKDRGKALFEFLSRRTGKRRPPVLRRSESPGWFVEFETKRRLEDVDKVRLQDGVPANPGPFKGEVDAVSLDHTDLRSHTMDRLSVYRRLVADLAGVRIYRDGFGIRVGEDWLGLGRQWTGGRSYYGLKPGNVLGFVALTAKDNTALVETTSREGFQVTPHYENFYALVTEFVRFTDKVQEFLRRGVLEYLNQYRERGANVNPSDTATDITRRIDDVVSSFSTEQKKLQRHAGTLQAVAARASSTLGTIRFELGATLKEDIAVASAVERLEQAQAEVSSVAADAERLTAEVSEVLGRASSLKALREVLDRRWDTLHDEVASLYESVSLGLTAEALSHEIHNIADGLARRSSSILREIKEGGVSKALVITYVEHVRSAVTAMRKQLAHLTPSLRYLRERKEEIIVRDFLGELAGFHGARCDPRQIELSIKADIGRRFSIFMNKGKLTQIFDNLLLNAEYWLRESLRDGTITHGEITLVIDSPIVRVFDNGKGVDPSVEETLFEPFVTTKRSGEGRGLGLFVVQQLLDSESCTILLLPERNIRERRYVFELDFSGAMGA